VKESASHDVRVDGCDLDGSLDSSDGSLGSSDGSLGSSDGSLGSLDGYAESYVNGRNRSLTESISVGRALEHVRPRRGYSPRSSLHA